MVGEGLSASVAVAVAVVMLPCRVLTIQHESISMVRSTELKRLYGVYVWVRMNRTTTPNAMRMEISMTMWRMMAVMLSLALISEQSEAISVRIIIRIALGAHKQKK